MRSIIQPAPEIARPCARDKVILPMFNPSNSATKIIIANKTNVDVHSILISSKNESRLGFLNPSVLKSEKTDKSRDVQVAVSSAEDILNTCEVDNFNQGVACLNISCVLMKNKINSIARQRAFEVIYGN